jgi:hypothetical protein
MSHEFEFRRGGEVREVVGRDTRVVSEIEQKRLPGAWLECRSGCTR